MEQRPVLLELTLARVLMMIRPQAFSYVRDVDTFSFLDKAANQVSRRRCKHSTPAVRTDHVQLLPSFFEQRRHIS